MNSATKSGYRFGDQFTSQLTGFREFQLKKFKLTPNIGLGFESSSKDNYANANDVLGTGGKGLFLSSAFNIKTGKWLLGFSYALPLIENYSQGEVIAQGRLAYHCTFIF